MNDAPVPREASPTPTILGREREIEELVGLFSKTKHRLITVTGPGGIGKTTLSLKIAEELKTSNHFRHHFIDLSGARSTEGFCHSTAQALDIKLSGHDDVEQIGHALQGRSDDTNQPLLIILDNLEQCIEEASPILRRWTTLAPNAFFLASSRIRLGNDDELEFSLHPLASDPSRELFVLHARLAQKDFDPDTATFAVIDKIIQRLDGLPLAIELAAARLRVLTPQQILERLDQRFALLRDSNADQNHRHATLNNTITWSWELLSEVEQDAFAQLSVFTHGFNLDAAEAVLDLSAYPNEFVIDVVQRLVERNLLRDQQRNNERTFSMYQSIHDFAREKLSAVSEAEATRQRWRNWLLRTSRRLWETRATHDGLEAQRKLATHVDALIHLAQDTTSSLEQRSWATIFATTVLVTEGGKELPTRLLLSCLREHKIDADKDISEITLEQLPDETHWLTMLLAQFTLRSNLERAGELIDLIPTTSPALFDALIGLLTAFQRQRDFEGMNMCVSRLEMIDGLTPYQQARVNYFKAAQDIRLKGPQQGLVIFEQLLSHLRELDTRRLEALALTTLGKLYDECREYDRAIHYHQLALKANLEIGHKNNAASCLGDLALLYARKGDFAQARATCERALIVDRELGNRFGHSHRLMALGLIDSADNNIDAGIDMAQRALEVYQSLSFLSGIALAQGLCGLIWLKRALGNTLSQSTTSSHGLDIASTFLDDAFSNATIAKGLPAEYFYVMARYLEASGQLSSASDYAKRGFEVSAQANYAPLLFEPDWTMIKEHGERIHQGRPLATSASLESVTIIGESQQTQKLRSIIEKAARSEVDVLILGETGSGKELVAHSIHTQSQRAHKRFVAINCGALPANLFESELFGHEKGAFTGADSTKVGLMEHAHGGTLFLDEIAEMPTVMQVKLLRALQERHIRRVGGQKQIPINIRVIAATMKNLKRALEDGQFREDLYYRIKVLQLEVPSLRQRKADIVPLAEHFLKQLDGLGEAKSLTLSDQVQAQLETYSWPGNVRELYNVMRHAHAMASGKVIEAKDLPELSDTPLLIPDIDNAGPLLAETLAERKQLIQLLTTHKGNVSAATKASGIDRRTFYRMLDRHGLEAASFRKKKS